MSLFQGLSWCDGLYRIFTTNKNFLSTLIDFLVLTLISIIIDWFTKANYTIVLSWLGKFTTTDAQDCP